MSNLRRLFPFNPRFQHVIQESTADRRSVLTNAGLRHQSGAVEDAHCLKTRIVVVDAGATQERSLPAHVMDCWDFG